MNAKAAIAIAVGACVCLGCARPPRPPMLAQAQQASTAPSAKDAAAFAPQMLAHAQSLRRQANEAYEAGDITGATTFAERSIVAYERAAMLTRLARAKKVAEEAEQTLASMEEKQRELDAEKRRLEADIASIDQLIRVVKDAQPLTPSPKSDHSREMARLKAARSIIVDARLLCMAAKLLNKPIQGLNQANARVAELEELLTKWPKPAPIDETLRARAQCLSLLTLARRSGSSLTPPDVVLTELSAFPNVQPIRDDRGVVVVIQGDVDRSSLAKARIEAVANTAKKFVQFPILVVGHTRAKPSRTTQQTARQRSQAVVDALLAAGISKTRIDTTFAGPHLPITHDPLPPPRNSENDRVEMILVAPSS